MPRADIVQVNARLSTSVEALGAFGVIIVGTNAPDGGGEAYENVLSLPYSGQTEMVDDDWSTSAGEYLAMGVAQSQNLVASGIRVGLVTLTAQVDTVTVDGNDDGVYEVTVTMGTGETVTATYTASSNTAEEIRDDLLGDLQGSSLPITAAAVSTDSISITADNAGQPFTTTLGGAQVANLSLANTTPNAGYSEGLQAIYAENDDFWGVYCVDDDDYHILEVAKGVAANGWGFALQDTSSAAVKADTAGNIAETLADASYARIGLVWHATPAQYIGIAILSNRLAVDPDKETTTWNGISLVGVTVDDSLTTAEQTALEANNVGYYMTHGAQGSTMKLSVADGNPIDAVLSKDWFQDRLQAKHIATGQEIANAGRKIPYNNTGITVIESDAREIYADATRIGHISKDEDVAEADVAVFNFPRMSTISDADRTNRVYNYSYSVPVAGAIENVGATITLEL